ncbi:hypothetical protein R1flu_027456 [Riccia fluitans]|uniref:Uncharacterized protein n=1 Tax=Riccia fluitans TaxID=41844 RepID=A0ABD1XJK8_9MARC
MLTTPIPSWSRQLKTCRYITELLGQVKHTLLKSVTCKEVPGSHFKYPLRIVGSPGAPFQATDPHLTDAPPGRYSSLHPALLQTAAQLAPNEKGKGADADDRRVTFASPETSKSPTDS